MLQNCTSQGQTIMLTFGSKVWWHNRNSWMHDDEENCLTIKWMKCKPPPAEVRMLIPNFYTEMLFNHVQALNIFLSFVCELPLIFFTLFFNYRYWNWWWVNAKNDVTTCLCVANDLKCTDTCLCHDCVNCKEILYEDEGEIEFDSDDEDDEE